MKEIKKLPGLLAIIFSFLAAVEFWFLPPKVGRAWLFIGYGIGMLWLMAILIMRRQRAETELHKLNSELEQRVNEQTEELRRWQQELELRVVQRTQELQHELAECKQAEGRLRHLSSAVEHSSASIVITDRAGNIEYVNPKFTAVTGYASEEVVGKNPRVLKSGEMPAGEYQRLWQTIMSGKEWQGEFHNRTKSGELYWESASISPIFDGAGEISHFVAVKENITERKLAEERICEQASLLDLTHDAIIVRDLEDRIVYWNKGADNIYGWTAQVAGGKKAAELLHEDIVAYHGARKIVLEKGAWKGEVTVRTKNGEKVLVETNWILVRDQKGTPKSIMVISADITEKRRLEIQTLRSQRMESVGTLASGIAHDLNNVLTPLLISVELLKGKIKDSEGQKLLDSLEANVLRGAKLVKQVLAFGRGVKGDRSLIQPASVVREIEQIIHETFPKSVELQTDFAADLWTGTGDATQFHQVLLNLCVNARDAMPDGGRLSIKMENVMLDEIYAGKNVEAKPGPYVVISVKDTGMGIPKEIQNKIFEPFFTTKAPGKGTGLGLSTSFGIIKNHGGFINCYSEVGKGSVFRVYLPANTSPVETKNLAMKPSILPQGHDELVLVVEDEEAILNIVQKTLEHFGYRVLTAANGAEAVSIYKDRQPEIAVVITDMAMPVMDGQAAVIALKAINPQVRIIRASGLDARDHDGTTKAKDACGEYFIPKPYTTETLIHTLQKALFN